MESKLKQILEQSPVPMDELLRLRDSVQHAGGRLLLTGCVNAGVPALLEAFGLGSALSGLQRPCVVELTLNQPLDIHLHINGMDVVCADMEELARRLLQTEDAQPLIRMAVPAVLQGWEKLLFVVLDGSRCREQLNQYALGCGGAVLVLDAVDAPSAEIYQAAGWLHEACDLSESSAVLFCGDVREPNAAPAMALSLCMGSETLPSAHCRMHADDMLPALKKLTACFRAGGSSAAAQQEIVRCAMEKLAAERNRIAAMQQLPRTIKLTLAQRFEAQTPGIRNRVRSLIGAVSGSKLSTDVREFSIFLQRHLEEMLVSSLDFLDQPKAALRSFAQGYLCDLMRDFCQALLQDMVSRETAPELLALYQRLFDEAWIPRSEEIAALPDNIRDACQETVDRMKQAGEALLDQAVSLSIKAVLQGSSRQLFFLSGTLSRLFIEPVRDLQFAIAKPERYAKQKAEALRSMLDEASASYQTLMIDEMVPQLRCELLQWFDDQVQQDLALLRAEDERLSASYHQQMQHYDDQAALLKAIAATESSLQALLQAADET